jgi:hypothetical protein
MRKIGFVGKDLLDLIVQSLAFSALAAKHLVGSASWHLFSEV